MANILVVDDEEDIVQLMSEIWLALGILIAYLMN